MLVGFLFLLLLVFGETLPFYFVFCLWRLVQIFYFEHLPSGLDDTLSQSLTFLLDAVKVFAGVQASGQKLFGQTAWWSRAWIVQEVVHGGEVSVHIGGLDPINFETLQRYKMVFNSIAQNMSQRVSARTKQDAFAMFIARAREDFNPVQNICKLRELVKQDPAFTCDVRIAMIAFRQQQATMTGTRYTHIFR